METKYLFAFLLFAVIIGNWNIYAKTQIEIDRNATISTVAVSASNSRTNKTQVRETRFARPYYGFIGIWNTLGNIRRIFNGVSSHFYILHYTILQFLKVDLIY